MKRNSEKLERICRKSTYIGWVRKAKKLKQSEITLKVCCKQKLSFYSNSTSSSAGRVKKVFHYLPTTVTILTTTNTNSPTTTTTTTMTATNTTRIATTIISTTTITTTIIFIITIIIITATDTNTTANTNIYNISKEGSLIEGEVMIKTPAEKVLELERMLLLYVRVTALAGCNDE
uniref:Uncharacterized protein n=1 Tax=Glossina pallidipes TaxID=7398 RepID=A0A1A9ZHZ9_GLOPL